MSSFCVRRVPSPSLSSDKLHLWCRERNNLCSLSLSPPQEKQLAFAADCLIRLFRFSFYRREEFAVVVEESSIEIQMPSISSGDLSSPLDGGVDFGSVKTVPESHAWQEPEGFSLESSDLDGIPVIDLSTPWWGVAREIGRACASWGAFQVVNHGVPDNVLKRVEEQGWRLFSLPPDQKLKAERGPDEIAGFGAPRITHFFPKRMWTEGFTVFGSPLEQARRLWPHDHMQFCEVIEEYQSEMKSLTVKLLELILEWVGAGKEDLNWEVGDSSGVTQLNSYPSCPEPSRAMGLAPHTDSSLLTVIHQSNTSGLQLLDASGQKWVTVPPVHGALVVNIGDLLHILSNGRCRSSMHRAVVNRVHHRLSFAYFCFPSPGATVEPLIGPDEPTALYRSVTWTEYLRIKGTLFNNALFSLLLPDSGFSTRLQQPFSLLPSQSRPSVMQESH
ncbi:gibberellin 3-beta-dioxygenase 3 [Amborella trichopoda]|nr:gibberellin 3-beta-dioxygenase 3 [Amborella trichopoda]|eukprot:XP_020517518.1 gibberellin 3-beta-dioxygenase 3 [Amborella trichopoda]